MAKVKVIFLAANPADTPRLRLDEEIRSITEKIRASTYRDHLELVSLWAVRADDLIQALNLHRPHIVHFSGHGHRSGEIVLEGDGGRARPIAAAALKALFTTLKDNIRLVILNACHSRPQVEAITEVIDCAIGMRAAIADRNAAIFVAAFYRAIGFGRSVQEAFEQGKTAILLEGGPEDQIPDLLVRAGVDPSRIHLIEPPVDEPRPVFWGPGFRAIELREVEPASEDIVRLYYKGEVQLSWPVIAAAADVEREIHGNLVRRFSSASARTRMLCLSGEPGAGKSTLAWRVASEIARITRQPLLQVLDGEADEPWSILASGAERPGGPLLVLADDVFRNHAVQRALEMLDPRLLITIIVTSRTNEIPDDLRLPFPLQIEALGPPTLAEKAGVLDKLRLAEQDLTAFQRKRLQHANSWLVMMLEITTGEPLTKIIRNSVKRLKLQDEIVHRAYEYLCYVGQYNLAMPDSLLLALDDRGRFYGLLDHPAGKGLIFASAGLGLTGTARHRLYLYKERLLCAQHPVIAREALKAYRRDPLSILGEIVRALQPDQRQQVFFFGSLLYVLILDGQAHLVFELFKRNSEKIQQILLASSVTDLIHRWVIIYRLLRDQEKVRELTSLALSRPPDTSADWKARFRVVTRRGTRDQIAKTIDEAGRWLAANPQDTAVRSPHLGLVERHGNPSQIADLIEQTAMWLAANPRNEIVRVGYLGIVERKGTEEQIASLIAATFEWLHANPASGLVRDAFLGMVERQGTKEETTRLLQDIARWLIADLIGSSYVRATFLGFVARQGTREQTVNQIEDTFDWLAANPRKTVVRSAYLRIVEQQGTPQKVAQAIDDTVAWLAANPDDIALLAYYPGLVERRGTEAQIARAIEDAAEWLAASSPEPSVRTAFLGLVKRCGTRPQIKSLIDDTVAWLDANPQDAHVRPAFMGLVEQEGTSAQLAVLIDVTAGWIATNPHGSSVHCSFLGLVERNGTRAQVAALIDDTAEWLRAWPSDVAIRVRHLALVRRRGTPEQIGRAIEVTQKWLDENPNSAHVKFAFSSLLAATRARR